MTKQFESIVTGVSGHIGNYADAVRVPAGADLIHTSGIPGLRPDGTVPEDFTEEVAQAWRNVSDVLAAAGTELGNVISVRQWLTDAADIQGYAAVRSTVITHQPVFMLAIVPALVWPNMRVEVEVTAIRPSVRPPISAL